MMKQHMWNQRVGDLGTSKLRETHWMVKICQLCDVLVLSCVSDGGLILPLHLLV